MPVLLAHQVATDSVRLLALVSHSWCCLVAQQINSRLKKHDDARDEFRLLSLLDTEISGDGRLHLTYSITFACVRSSLKPRLRQMLRAYLAPSTPVWSLTGSTFIGSIVLNFLEGDVYRVVAQPTGSLIDQCEIMQRDCLNILRLAAPHADMLLTPVVHCQIRIFGNSLSFAVTRLTCLRSIESGVIGIVKSSINMFEELALRSTEDISRLTEAPRIMIASWQPFSRTQTLIRFSLEFLGVFRHSELKSIVSDFLDYQNSTKPNKQCFIIRFFACVVLFEGPSRVQL